MKKHKTSYDPPYPSPARMGADPKHDSAQRKSSTPYGKFHNIAGACPGGTERLVFLFTPVFDLCWELAAFKVGVLQLAVIGTRDSSDLLLATLGKAVCNGNLCIQDLWAVDNEPVKEVHQQAEGMS